MHKLLLCAGFHAAMPHNLLLPQLFRDADMKMVIMTKLQSHHNLVDAACGRLLVVVNNLAAVSYCRQ